MQVFTANLLWDIEVVQVLLGQLVAEAVLLLNTGRTHNRSINTWTDLDDGFVHASQL